MCVAQHRWTGCKGLCSPALPLTLLLLLPLPFFTSTPLFAQGAIQIPKDLSQPPVLTEETELLRSYTAFSKEDIDLPCEATGNPPPIFRWVKDGEQFGPPLNGSGTINADEDEPLESYQGHYRCYASNALGTAMTRTVQIIVEPQPVLLKQQKIHKKAYEGESIILTCNPPESSAPPYIHWMDKRMVHIKQNDRVMVGLDGNLYFSNVLKSDSRDDYTCNAQYSAARTILPDTAVTLTVLTSNDVGRGKKPQLFLPTGSHTSLLALQGHSVTLECIPKGLPTPKVEWKKKDGKLEETSGRKDNYNRWLYFDSITQKDDGEYECEATNSNGRVKHSFTLTVEAAPYWVKHPKNLLYAPGETVRLECVAEGVPTPIITWSINGEPLAAVDDEPRRSVNMGVLKLADVEFSDTAVYQCEATNKHGSILINSYLHVIELPPQILSPSDVVYEVAEGKNIEMLCESFGSPRPHVVWEAKDRGPLLSDSRVSQLTSGTLQISNVVHDDAGTYECFTLKDSNISISVQLKVFNRTIITTEPQDVRELRGTSAFLDCRFKKDPRLKDYKILWLKDGWMLEESSLSDKYTVFNNGTLKVTDLESDDTGSYTCEVSTSLDKVMASGSITVVAPPDPPENLALSDVKDWSLTLSWIPGKSHNSPITDFIVEAREEQHSEQGKWMWEEIKKVSGQFNNLVLDLHPFCTYRFRVIAVNQVGRSEPSESTVFYTTPPAVPRHNPTGVRSDSTEPDTLVITWDEMHKRQHNGQDFQYKVLWKERGGQWNHGYAKSPPFHVNNTGTYSEFEIKVQAVNSLGEGPRPKAVTGHSGEDNPEEPPTDINVMVMNSTIRLTWNEAQRVRGHLLGYKIYIERLGSQGPRGRRSLGNRHHQTGREQEGRSEHSKEKQSRTVVVHGTKTSEEVSGLQLFSRYEVSMSAFNSKGESPQSRPVHFITPEGAPGAPASLTYESPSEQSLILHWTPPTETNGVLLGYMVQYQQDVKDQKSQVQIEFISDPSVTHLVLDSLDSSSYYNFNVSAWTAAGYGPPIRTRGATLFDGVAPTNITITRSDTSLNLSWVPGERERNHEFQIEYCRKSSGGPWEVSEVLNSSQGFYTLTGLKPGSEYHLRIMQGNDSTWQVLTFTDGARLSNISGGFATQGWLIGLISAIVLLILILLILCLIKRSKGGKYAVKDKEDKEVDSEARPMKDETFGEYRSLESDADEKRSDSQPSLCGDSKLGSDDSLAEYGDSVDIQFNEDGSFIGQYSGRAPVPPGNESSGPASPVNAVPPPPIAPSMSSILNRPS
ncbi:neural cell adhesion molecule L1.1-like isoform X2 [Synchiropus splendidus]|uniref:neural cell adhesion molecule L1.1-like isoform X2 n=1 Tax=Synchiropus splendidus TaxID=270530 RepID=UPI00237D922F|nr:neural cell adhesion molecule L1.1-like isoform X2 [Synchiropus splendidus]